MHRRIAFALIVVAVVLMMIGGKLDIKKQERLQLSDKVSISKEHYWADGLFLGLLSVWLCVWCGHKA
ncbi:MAG: hypothetical protein KGL39_09455 [Patescibacteria group bacterium]|nr:hypothetical protein [Patescibacteria group bacterium]